MFLIYGRKTARIGMYSDHHEQCKNCSDFDISVAVLREYFHIFFIPVWPIGPKNTKAWCHSCGQSFGNASFDQSYEAKARTPIYFYALSIIIGGLIAAAVIGNISTQREKAKMVESPRLGDVYLIREENKDSTTYYFLKVTEVNGTKITMNHSSLIYYTFRSWIAPEDSFVTAEPLIYHKTELKEMLDSDKITSVQRTSSSD